MCKHILTEMSCGHLIRHFNKHCEDYLETNGRICRPMEDQRGSEDYCSKCEAERQAGTFDERAFRKRLREQRWRRYENRRLRRGF